MEPGAYHEMAQLQQSHWWYRGRRNVLAAQIHELKLKQNSEILEIGAGPGGNLEMLNEFGHTCAVEMDPDAAAHARTIHPDLDIRIGSLPDDFPFDGRKFDMIAMLDVLEHIDHDVQALISLKQHLKSDGVLLLSVPAYQWMWSKHDVRLHHCRRYNALGLARILDQAGWGVQKITYFNTFLFPIAVAARFVDKLVPRDRPTGAELPPSIINSALERIFSIEAGLVRRSRLLFGLSILCVAQPVNP